MRRPSCRTLFSLACLTFLGLYQTPSLAQLNIVPTFDPSISSRSDAAVIISSINEVIDFYRTRFTNPVTVTIKFTNMDSGLGQSATYRDTVSYSDFYAALQARATSANDTLALARIAPDGNGGNPVNGNAQIASSLPHLRLLGFPNQDPPTGEADSTISLNLAIMNFTRNNPDPAKYDLRGTLCHEINEVLGFGSVLNGMPNSPITTPTTPIGSLDLFRYDQNGIRSLTTDPTAKAYLSLDGTRRLERFNQTAGGDFHDFYSDSSNGASEFTPSVQDAFGLPGGFTNMGAGELVGLDVIGYTLKTAAVSGTITLEGSVNTAQPITFEFRPIGDGISFVRTQTLTNTGSYSFNDIPVANYNIRIKGAKWLAKVVSANAVSGDISGLNVTLLGGDANNDNAVDITDLLALIAHYNQVSPAAGFLEAADFNSDGKNDISDLLILIANYNKIGSP